MIEKNIPIETSLAATLREMEIGDSFLIVGKKSPGMGNTTGVLKPKKFTVRKREGGYRIWRIA